MSKPSTFIATTLAAAASTILASTTPVFAADPSIVVTAAPVAVPVRSVADRSDVAGIYRLADGRLLELRARPGTVVADLDGQPGSLVLRATDATTLSTADRRVTMRFSRDRDDTMQVTLSTTVDGGAPQMLAALAAPKR
jgi:hypothetical protein